MSLAAHSGATLTAAARVVVPIAGATELTTVAASDVLGAGDVPEDEELCRKKIYSELNLATRCKKWSIRKLDKPRFSNAYVGSFGRRSGAASHHCPLGAHRRGKRLAGGR
jgi:hypothetical protein